MYTVYSIYYIIYLSISVNTHPVFFPVYMGVSENGVLYVPHFMVISKSGRFLSTRRFWGVLNIFRQRNTWVTGHHVLNILLVCSQPHPNDSQQKKVPSRYLPVTSQFADNGPFKLDDNNIT